jgi:hypothetical protein
MESRAEVPGWLAISWWWLVLLLAVNIAFGFTPFWIPRVIFEFLLGAWLFAQQAWLRSVERESRAIYWYAASLILTLCSNVFTLVLGHHTTLSQSLFEGVVALVSFGLWIAAVFKYADELEDHFKESPPHGLGFSGIMIFFFSTIYFQYKLHEIYVQDHAEDQLLITPFEA